MQANHDQHPDHVSDGAAWQDSALAASIIAHADDAIIAKTVDGTVLSWNAGAERIFGYTAGEMIGQPITRLFPEDRLHEESDLIAQIQAGGEISHFETRRVRKDGVPIDVSVTLSAIRDIDGRIVAASKIARDITQYKRLQARARLAEELQQGLDQSSLRISLWGSNEKNRYANSAYAAQWNLRTDELLGRHFSDVLDPAVYARAKPLADAARAGRPQLFEREVPSRDGGSRYELVNLIPGRPVDEGVDERRGLFIVITDITLQVQAQKAAAAAAERFRRLYEDTPAMVHASDPQGRLLAISNTWLRSLGHAREAVLGTNVADYLTPHSRVARQNARQAIAETGRCENVPLQAVCKSGQVMDVLMSAILERDGNGQPMQTLTVLQDVTERLRAERALNTVSARLAAVIEGTGAGTWEWNVQTGETYYSERWASLLGYELDEVPTVGNEARERATHPDERAWSRAVLFRHLTGETEAYECDVRLRRKDGSWLWVRERGRVTTRSADGRALVVHGIMEDISERKLREFKLAQSESLLNRTGALAGVGGWELDLRSDDLWWSEQTRRICGVGPDFRPTLDRAIDFYAPEARPVITAAVAAAVADGSAWDLELPFVRADGHRLWVRATGTAEFEAGQAVRLVGAFQDISDRVAQRQALESVKERMVLANDSGGIGIWDYDLSSGEVAADDWMYRLFRLPVLASNRPFASWLDQVHEDDRDSVGKAVAESIGSGRPLAVEFRALWPDGSLRRLKAAANVHQGPGEPQRMVGVCWDVTELHELGATLARQHELMRVTMASIGDAVLTTDEDGRVTWLNPIAERMTGWSCSEAVGRPSGQVLHLVHQTTRAAAASPIDACLRSEETAGLAQQTVLIARSGVEYGIEDSASPIRAADGAILGCVLVFHDVTEQRRISSEMTYRATHDALTGLVNRAEFEARLKRVLEVAHQRDSRHALFYLDLDQFKLVNDACGHSVGDQLLQQISKLLSEIVRSRDTLARLGGDEFAVILEHCEVEQAQRVAQAICDRMDDFRFIHDERRFRVGASIGLVPIDRRWPTTAAAMQAADASCYAAKEAGRNRVHLWFDTDAAMRTRHGQTQWATRLEQALHDETFTLHLQRVIPLKAGNHGLHAEVLLRLRDSDGSLTPPALFLPAAERFHLAARIDRWVIHRVVQQLMALPSLAGIEMMAVNVSGQSVGDRSFHRAAIEELRSAGPEVCRRLCIEITETAAITNMSEAAQFIEQLRDLGVRTALDDFGAGASSFGYLKTLKVDLLKIDGQFVRDILDDPLDDAAVRCFVDVARVLGVQCVAEFVDQPGVLARIRELGVDYAQGFLLHEPEDMAAVLEACVA